MARHHPQNSNLLSPKQEGSSDNDQIYGQHHRACNVRRLRTTKALIRCAQAASSAFWDLTGLHVCSNPLIESCGYELQTKRSAYVPLTCWNGAARGKLMLGAPGLPQLTPFPRFLVLVSGERLAKRTCYAAHIPAPKTSIRRNEMAGGSKQEVMPQSLGVLCVKWLYEAFFTLLHAGSHHTQRYT